MARKVAVTCRFPSKPEPYAEVLRYRRISADSQSCDRAEPTPPQRAIQQGVHNLAPGRTRIARAIGRLQALMRAPSIAVAVARLVTTRLLRPPAQSRNSVVEPMQVPGERLAFAALRPSVDRASARDGHPLPFAAFAQQLS